MNLGFIGVGKHGQRMAAVFRELGAEIVAFDCATAQQYTADWYYDDGSKYRTGHNNAWSHGSTKADFEHARQQRWQSMVTDSTIDAIVCCTPPLVTTMVAWAAANVAKRVCATKPLMWPVSVADSRGVYVDLWRLYSPAWLALKADLQCRRVSAVHVAFFGDGPTRQTHSGLLDYGPHALAFVLDLGFQPQLAWSQLAPGQWEARSDDEISIVTGNGFAHSGMRVRVATTDGGQYVWTELGQLHIYEAGGTQLMQHWRDLALRNFCRAFLRGDQSDTLRISCDAMRLLMDAESQYK